MEEDAILSYNHQWNMGPSLYSQKQIFQYGAERYKFIRRQEIRWW